MSQSTVSHAPCLKRTGGDLEHHNVSKRRRPSDETSSLSGILPELDVSSKSSRGSPGLPEDCLPDTECFSVDSNSDESVSLISPGRTIHSAQRPHHPTATITQATIGPQVFQAQSQGPGVHRGIPTGTQERTSTAPKNTGPTVTKTSCKYTIEKKLLSFQNPINFMKWFENLENFLIQASAGNYVSPAKAATPKTPPRATSVHVNIAPVPDPTKVAVASLAKPTVPTSGTQTLIVPVAGASANGNMILAPSNLPPASANLNSAQIKYNLTTLPTQIGTVGALSAVKKTVREMLDSQRLVDPTEVTSSTATSAAPAVVPVTLAAPTTTQAQSVLRPGVTCIDLTEDDENSPTKTTQTAPQTTNATMVSQVAGLVTQQGAAQQLVVRPQAPNAAALQSNPNIRPGTYLVPVTSGQSILLQSIGTQMRNPQPTTLVYTSAARAPGASGARPQIVVPATSAQQLMPMQPGQPPQLRPSTQLLVRQAAPTPTTIRGPPPLKAAPSTQAIQAKMVPVASTQGKSVAKHPAPLPPQPVTSKIGADLKGMPPKPSLKISRVSQGIVLSWNMALNDNHADIGNYQLFAYQEGTSQPSSVLWKRVGDVKALPLPMACTLTQFQEGNKYHFAVRGVDSHGRIGPFSDPSSIHLEPTTSTS